jgi:hypothetical protein
MRIWEYQVNVTSGKTEVVQNTMLAFRLQHQTLLNKILNQIRIDSPCNAVTGTRMDTELLDRTE